MSTTLAPTATANLKALTSLRFFAALMIFLYHLREYNAGSWLYAISAPMLHGVSFFFVLSGFILTHAYIDRRDVSARDFFLTRFARLYPTIFVSILVLVAILPIRWAFGQQGGVGLGALALILKLTMTDSLVPTLAMLSSWNSVSWSLSTEFFFYAAFPLLLIDLRSTWAWKLSLAATVALATLALGYALGMQAAIEGAPMTATLMNLAYAQPLVRGFEFVLGMCAYLAWSRWLRPAPLSRPIWTTIEVLALLLLGAWLTFGASRGAHMEHGLFWAWFRVAGSCWAVALIIPIFASARGAIGEMLSAGPMVWLGEISFAFYVYHVIVMRAMSYRFGYDLPILAVLAISLVLAAVSHRWVELPARQYLLARFGRRVATARAETLDPRVSHHSPDNEGMNAANGQHVEMA